MKKRWIRLRAPDEPRMKAQRSQIIIRRKSQRMAEDVGRHWLVGCCGRRVQKRTTEVMEGMYSTMVRSERCKLYNKVEYGIFELALKSQRMFED